MKATVAYHSLYGNTKVLADAIAAALSEAGDVATVEIAELTAATIQGADLVVMGAPTHNMNAPEEVRTALDALPAAFPDWSNVRGVRHLL